jgi:hypothetical protein
MSYTNRPTPAALDKVVIYTNDFEFNPEQVVHQRPPIKYGKEQGMDSYYYNAELFNVDINSKSGAPVFRLSFNPNKVSDTFVLQELADKNIYFDMDKARVRRIDIERTCYMPNHISAYREALYSATNERNIRNAYDTTFRFGTGGSQVVFYDKSIEANLPLPNLHRLEAKLLNASTCRKSGIMFYSDLKSTDLHTTYVQRIHHHLPNLHKLEAVTVNRLASMQNFYNALREAGERAPLDIIMRYHGFNNLGIGMLMGIIDGAPNLTRQQRWREKKWIREQSAKFAPVTHADVVADLLQFVA